MLATISLTRTPQSRLTEDLRENSPFGTNYSDHLFIADYADGKWQAPRIVPSGPMQLPPATTALHYGQSLFEGFKAHRTADGRVALFRPMVNHARLNRTAARLAMPEIPEEIFREGLLELIRGNKDGTPNPKAAPPTARPANSGPNASLM